MRTPVNRHLYPKAGESRVEVDFYDVGPADIWLEVFETTKSGKEKGRLALLTPKEARKIGKALVRAAKIAASR